MQTATFMPWDHMVTQSLQGIM